jgi:hypothetical protein
MLSGFNTDFRHRGVLFHVQTEDSGLDNPHVITHLFHGGNILASEKRDYADLLGQENIEEPIRKLMESQHKTMLKRLSRGEHDSVLFERLGPEVFGVEAPTAELSPEATSKLPPQAPKRPHQATSSPLAPTKLETARAPAPPASEAPPSTRLPRVFGDRVASEKPLDEAVLDYLVENARKRKRPPK